MARQALEAGCHALIEKPLSQSFAGVPELRQLRDARGLRVAVAYVLHSYDLYSEVRDFIRSGGIGAVKQVVHSSGQHFPTCRPAHTVPYYKTYYKDRATGGGAIQDGLTHVANWIESVLGPTDSLYCDCAHQVLAHVSVEDTVNLCARHGDALVNYTMNQFQAPNESFTQFNAEAGSVRMEVHLRRWGIQRLGETAWTWKELPPVERDTFFVVQANRFLDLVEGRPASLCSLEAAEQTLRFNLAALASADQGVRVHCASVIS
jgi:predicted dehydrogenase